MNIITHSIPQPLADEVRRTRKSPGYGHPVHEEIAGGTGPCRCCLRPFVPGVDRRLLFTYRPPARGGSLMAPGPVFIHADHCQAYEQENFPDALRGLPLAYEARTDGGRVIAVAGGDASPEEQLESLFAAGAQWVHLRHAEAGCFIARIEKGPAVSRGAW